MKNVILNTPEKARGPIGFVGEAITPRQEEHYGVTFQVQPDGSRIAEVSDEDAVLMSEVGRVVIQA
jgi:hypothetical protein